MSKLEAKINIDQIELDQAIEKANQLKELLLEVHKLIDSLAGSRLTEEKTTE